MTLLTTNELAAALRVSRRTVQRLRSTGVIRPALGRHRCVRWHLDTVLQQLARR